MPPNVYPLKVYASSHVYAQKPKFEEASFEIISAILGLSSQNIFRDRV